jgi:enoyl-CoA hydratase
MAIGHSIVLRQNVLDKISCRRPFACIEAGVRVALDECLSPDGILRISFFLPIKNVELLFTSPSLIGFININTGASKGQISWLIPDIRRPANAEKTLTMTGLFRYKGNQHRKELLRMNTYPFFEVEKVVEQQTAVLYLNRPEKLNAMNWPFWRDLPLVVDDLEKDPEIRVVIIAGRGKSFSVGIDVFEFFMTNQDTLVGATPEFREKFYDLIIQMQEGFNHMTQGRNIYIAAVHRHCIGGALDLVSACDLRLAAKDALFSLREAKIAIVADMGSLNRLPNIIGQGNTRMLAFTGRDCPADVSLRMGLVNELYENQEELMKGALDLAKEIAGNADNAVRGTKNVLNYMENHSVDDGLKYVAAWNSAFFNTGEVQKAFQRSMESKKK